MIKEGKQIDISINQVNWKENIVVWDGFIRDLILQRMMLKR